MIRREISRSGSGEYVKGGWGGGSKSRGESKEGEFSGMSGVDRGAYSGGDRGAYSGGDRAFSKNFSG